MKRNVHGNKYTAVAADGAIDRDHPLNRNRVLWWYTPSGIPAAGSRWLDLCGKNHGTHTASGTTTRPAWTNIGTGGGSAALSYDGSSTYTVASTNFTTSLGGLSNASMAFTVYRDNTKYIKLGAGQNPVTTWMQVSWEPASAGVPNGFYVNFYSSGSYSYPSGVSVATGWARAMVTFDGSQSASSRASIYVNGQSLGALTLGNVWPAATLGSPVAGYEFSVARMYDGGAFQYSPLTYREMSIWTNRTLTPADVAEDYRLSQVSYQTPNSPIRWVSTRTYSIPAAVTPRNLMLLGVGA